MTRIGAETGMTDMSAYNDTASVAGGSFLALCAKELNFQRRYDIREESWIL